MRHEAIDKCSKHGPTVLVQIEKGRHDRACLHLHKQRRRDPSQVHGCSCSMRGYLHGDGSQASISGILRDQEHIFERQVTPQHETTVTLTFCPNVARFGTAMAGNLIGSKCEGQFRRIKSWTAVWE